MDMDPSGKGATLRALMMVPLLISVAACGSTGGAGPTASAVASPSATPTPTPTPPIQAAFFPLAAGDTWTYSHNPLTGCGQQVSTEIDTIASVTRAADGSLKAVDNLGGSEYSRSNPGPETYTVTPDGSVQGTLSGNTFGLFPPAAVIRSGQSVPIDVGQQGGVLSATAHGAGVVSVSVPAGTFTAQVVVVDETSVGPGVFPGSGATPGPSQTTLTTTYWLVAGVGLVEQTDPSGSEHGVACTDVLQLTQYHVAASS
jgi:hypothetical protein